MTGSISFRWNVPPDASSRPGPNLYTDSLVTLDALTGALDWFQQAIPHPFKLLPQLVDAGGIPSALELVNTDQGVRLAALLPTTSRPRKQFCVRTAVRR